MQFLLLLAAVVMMGFALSRLGRLVLRLQIVDQRLKDLGDSLDALARNISPHLPEPAAQPAETAHDFVRSRVSEHPAPQPPPAPAAPTEAPVPPPSPAAPIVEQTVATVVPPTPEPTPPPPSVTVPPIRLTIADAEIPPPSPPPPPSSTASTPPPPLGPDFLDLEKRFGTQWVVWIGGIALALGGIFLVRYSIEAGLFGPKLRVFLGAILALVLVGLGEIARRREIISGLDKIPNAAHIPSILTAAGTTCAYADIWAAYALYDFLSPAVAFLLLGLVALATLAAALLHGPALGGLGLIGAYLTPALVGSQQPNYWALFVYLSVVTAAAYALARVRMWRWLAITAATLSILWMFAGDPSGASLWANALYAFVCFALAAYFLVPGLFEGPPAEPGRFDPVSCGILAGYLFAAFMLAIAMRHDEVTLIALFVLMAATVAIAWRTEAAMLAMPAAAILGVALISHWAVNWQFVIVIAPPFVPAPPIPRQPAIAAIGVHQAFALATAAVFGAGGYFGQDRTQNPLFSMLWAGVAVATAIALLVLVYYRIAHFEQSIPFAGIALVIAALCAAAAESLWKRESRPGLSEAGAIFATGAVAGLALTLTFALERGWLTVGLALMAPGIAMIADKRPVPILRKLCGGIAAIVLARVAWDPRIVGDAVGTTPIFNWLLWGYGVPAVSFWVAGHLLRKRADDVIARSIDSAAILFTALTAFFEIRHLMNDGDIYRPAARLGELGLQISTALAMVIGLEHIRVRSASIVHDWGARILAGLAFAGIVFGPLLGANPMVTGEPVGGVLFNYVLLGYGIPAVLTGILARVIRYTRPQPYYVAAAIASIVLMLIYLTLEVRTIFQGAVLRSPYMSDAEDYTYSVVWLAFGVALLIAGVLLKSQPARLASAAVVMLTIGKVFLHDLAGVQGIYRALSFIGLGLVLMAIGWLYQRLLFPQRGASAVPPPGAAPPGS